MLHWLWRSFKTWAFDWAHASVFCLSSIVCIEKLLSIGARQFASNVQHFLLTCQKNCLSVTLLILWAQSRVYLEMISFRGIGRPFYAILDKRHDQRCRGSLFCVPFHRCNVMLFRCSLQTHLSPQYTGANPSPPPPTSSFDPRRSVAFAFAYHIRFADRQADQDQHYLCRR